MGHCRINPTRYFKNMVWNPVRFMETVWFFRGFPGPASRPAPVAGMGQPRFPQVALLQEPEAQAVTTALAAALTQLGAAVVTVTEPPGEGWIDVAQGWICPGTATLPERWRQGWQRGAVETTPVVTWGAAAMATTWGALDDGVMGGVSQSGLIWVDQEGGWARFAGVVSTANGGGFASVRSRNFEPPLNLTGWQGLSLQVRGDGQRYKVIFRDQSGWDGLAHAALFDTEAGHWSRVTVPFSAFQATFRARTVPTAAPLDLGALRSLQWMLSKFEFDGNLNPQFRPGPFQLDLGEVCAYRPAPTPPLVAIALTPEQQHTYTAQLQTWAIPHQVVLAPAGADLTADWLRSIL